MNSLDVYLSPCRSPGILSAKIWVRDGSRADPINKKGLHSLLGSLLIRGCGPYNNLQLADLVEGLGAVLLSETYEDGIMISLKCTEEGSNDLLPLLKWIILEPRLEKEQIDLERQLSIQAINRQKENQFILALNKWKEIAYQNHPYSQEVIGSIKDLKTITRTDLTSLSEKISSRQKVIVISGSLPANIDTYLKDLKVMNYNPNKKMGESISDNFKKPNHFDTDKSIVITPQNTKQVVIILGSTTIPHSHPDDIALRILSCHLGSGMSSVLFNILREEKGLTYDVGIYYPVRELNAPFIIHASSSKDKAMETLILIKKCWNNLQYSLLSNEELDLAKSKFRYNFAHNSQTISQRAERKAHLIGLNIDENYDLQILNSIDSITKEDIIRVSSLYLKWPVLSLCGPEDKLNQLRDFWIESSN